jgi:hypothetical protein
LGSICKAIFKRGKTVHLLGTATEPLLVLERSPTNSGDKKISIDEARADWSNVTLAAAIYRTRFEIESWRSTPRREHLVLAVLYRHPKARHPAERYLRSPSADAERLAREIEVLALEVRKLGQASAQPVAAQRV